MVTADFQPVFGLSRGGHPESQHLGAIAVVDAKGKLLASHGNANQIVFPRSSSKPFQAMPFVVSGGVDTFSLKPAELALICASHSGTDEHVLLAIELQKKIGVREENLLCGVHAPYHQETALRFLGNEKELTGNRHNCSGKHIGMLALAKMRGWKLENYVDLQHPVQIEIRETLARWTNLAEETLIAGVDGCSAPNYAVPIRNMAFAIARLMQPLGMTEEEASAAQTIREAMLSHPQNVAGPGRFDTALMRATNSRILSKAGAEGYQALGIMQGKIGPKSAAMGICLKIADGDARGWARSSTALEVLRQLGALTDEEMDLMREFGPHRSVKNHRNLIVGEAAANFKLLRY